MTEKTTATEQDLMIELSNVCKAFPGVNALTDVHLDIKKGEVHAVVGENGAGKSTLIKIITGFHQMDSGSIKLDGKEVCFTTPNEAICAGIACIYQELSIVPLLDVAYNIFLGNWPQIKGKLLDRRRMYKEAGEILKKIELNISPKVLAGDISIAQQQMVEIGRALTRNARLIIMDEPTSSLTDREAEVLFKLIERLRGDGVSIVYISHKIDEVLRISDRITVLCDGKNIKTLTTASTNRKQIIEYMLGRKMDDMYNKLKAELGDVALSVKGLTRGNCFRDVNFTVNRGEVLGFFGLIGAGRSEIMRAIFGIDKYDYGTICIDGSEVRLRNPVEAVEHGIALIPEDRKKEGLALRLGIVSNMTLVKLPQISKQGLINKKEQLRLTDKFVKDIRIKTPHSNQLVCNLSGGNQQKVVISKWLMMNPQILILDEPTRGIDVGSKSEIYGLIGELANKGVAVIVVSSEMQEILGICDRIITVFEGRVTAEFNRENATDRQILAAALGGEI